MKEKPNEFDDQSIEAMMESLKDISCSLKRKDIGLEESLKLYEKGYSISKACREKLAKADLKIENIKALLNSNSKEGTDILDNNDPLSH